jgi:hypothetical protein
MDPLASSDDVAASLGRSLTGAEEDRVAGILAKASALFRRRSRQDFAPGTSTVRLKVDGGQIRLEQTPAIAVTAVIDDKGRAIDHQLAGQLLFLTRNGCPLAAHEFVTVTYSHGGVVPDLVRLTIAEIAAKVLRIDPKAAAGVVTASETTGPFSETNTYALWAVGGETLLAPEDDKIALSYRYPRTQVIVCQPGGSDVHAW